LNLFDTFHNARLSSGRDLYLRQDSHWSPYGAEVAARALAKHLPNINQSLEFSNAQEDSNGQSTKIEAPSDLWDMLKKSWRPGGPDFVEAVNWKNVEALPATEAEVILMGDSFLDYYRNQEHGFGAALRSVTGWKIEDIVAVGSPAMAINSLKSELHNFRVLKVVVWLFAERKLGANGIEGEWADN
jgi:hypothetical protein